MEQKKYSFSISEKGMQILIAGVRELISKKREEHRRENRPYIGADLSALLEVESTLYIIRDYK